MFSNRPLPNTPKQHYVSRPATNDLENARRAQSWPLPLRSSAGGRLRKGVGNYERDLRKLEHKQNSDLLDKLFWYQEFGSRSNHAFRFSENDTFGTALIKLRQTLRQSSRSSSSFLQLCIINTSPATTKIASWPARQIVSVRDRLDELLVFPRWVVGIELEQAWGGLSECACKSIERAEKLLKVEQLSLPEFRRQFLSHSFSLCKCRDLRVETLSNSTRRGLGGVNGADRGSQWQDKKMGNVGLRRYPKFRVELPSKGREETSPSAKLQLAQCYRIFDRTTASFSFAWQRNAPKYGGGIDNFLWERHNLPPSCDYAEIFFQDDRALPGPRRVLMTCSKTPEGLGASSMMEDFKFLLKTRRADEPDIWPYMLLLQSNPHSDGYSLLPIFIVLQEIIGDSAIFLQQASDEIRRLSFAGRSKASVAKVQYLCHLDDCRESAVAGITHAYSISKDISSILKKRRLENTPVSVEAEYLKEKQADMEFLIEQLEEHLKDRIRIESVQMKEHRMLVQCRQISTLTYLSFVFLPLFFITGMLSMNVNDPSSIFHTLNNRHSNVRVASQPATILKRQDDATSTSTDATPTPTSTLSPVASSVLFIAQNMDNATAALSSVPEVYIWPFSVFFGMSIALLVTSVTLPFLGPSLLRGVLKPWRRVKKAG